MAMLARRLTTIGVLVTACFLLTAVAVAIGAAARDPNMPTVIQGNSVTSVTVVRETVEQEVSDVNWRDLPGATATVTIPDGTTALMLIRFSSTSTCAGFTGL